MKFGTTTHIILENQMVKTVEPTLKTVIIAAPFSAVKDYYYSIPDDGAIEAQTMLAMDGETALTEGIVYAAVYGKVRGEATKKLIWQSQKVLTETSNWESIQASAELMGASAIDSDGVTGTGVEVVDTITVYDEATYRMLYDYYVGSPIRIRKSAGVGEEAVYLLSGLPTTVSSNMRNKNIVVMFEDGGTAYFSKCTMDEKSRWVTDASVAAEYDKVAILENPFNLGEDGEPHGTLYFDYVYPDASLAGEMYYIEELDQLKDTFGNAALTLGPGGAAYNAYLYMLANGSKDGFYVYCPEYESEALSLYLTNTEITTALDEIQKNSDIYDVLCITKDAAAAATIAAHIEAMAVPDERRERRGYVGTYRAPDEEGEYAFNEFDIMCAVGQAGAKAYMLDRYTTKTGYINATMLQNVYNNQRMTVLETKWGIVEGQYVTASTLLAIYVGYRNTFDPGYVMAGETVPMVSDVSFAGLFNDMDHMDKLENAGVMSIWRRKTLSPVQVYYPCTSAPDYPQLAEEYNVIATDMFARECREALIPHIACGTGNKISADPTNIKTYRYFKKLEGFMDVVKYRYIKYFKVFADVELLSIDTNPNYQGGVLIAVAITYTYAVKGIEVIIYI